MLALNIIAALFVIFEEWGWRPLSNLLARLSKFGFWATLERGIAGLPPYAALLIFALPVALLLPLKFVAVWLLAQGQVWTATGLFVGAKIVSTALIARIFTLTKPALMQITWFAEAYNWFVPWKDAFFAEIRTSRVWQYGRRIKTRIRREAALAWLRMRPTVAARWLPWAMRLRIAAARLKARLFGTDAH